MDRENCDMLAEDARRHPLAEATEAAVDAWLRLTNLLWWINHRDGRNGDRAEGNRD